MTLSGGEALLQPEFCQSLLAAARAEGLHTCAQTAGHVSVATFAKVAHVTDLFLFDFKISDSELHRQWTGVGNERIQEALAFLATVDAPVLLRCRDRRPRLEVFPGRGGIA
jgi:pyruvate formate lyase activating enzyme